MYTLGLQINAEYVNRD